MQVIRDSLILCRGLLAWKGMRGGRRRKITELGQDGSTRSAGLAPCSSKHLAAPRHRLEAAICRAEPWLKSLHVEFTTGR